MFDYFSLLMREHKLPVYPIAVLSWDSPLREEPDTFEVVFPNRTVMWFKYDAIQLNRLDWRLFAERQNPVAAALMAKMRIAPEDRPRVKLQCFRLLATLRLDPARSRLISGFVNRYLQLTAEEFAAYKREVDSLSPAQREEVTVITNEFKEEGIREGLQKEALSVARLLLRTRFPHDADRLEPQIEPLSISRLEALCVALLNISRVEEAERWLAGHSMEP